MPRLLLPSPLPSWLPGIKVVPKSHLNFKVNWFNIIKLDFDSFPGFLGKPIHSKEYVFFWKIAKN